jgi:hypothetical protein
LESLERLRNTRAAWLEQKVEEHRHALSQLEWQVRGDPQFDPESDDPRIREIRWRRSMIRRIDRVLDEQDRAAFNIGVSCALEPSPAKLLEAQAKETAVTPEAMINASAAEDAGSAEAEITKAVPFPSGVIEFIDKKIAPLNNVSGDPTPLAALPASGGRRRRRVLSQSEAEKKAERKAARDHYQDECADHGIPVTNLMIAEEAFPESKDPLEMFNLWLRCHRSMNGRHDDRVRKVFKDKPHLPKQKLPPVAR